jgi:hypothetical protein
LRGVDSVDAHDVRLRRGPVMSRTHEDRTGRRLVEITQSNDLLAEWHERSARHLEGPHAERDADDGQTEQAACEEV